MPGALRLLGAVVFAACSWIVLQPATAADTTTRVNVSNSGAQATGSDSSEPSISLDGDFVVFKSGASNLVAGDSNGLFDIFMRDRRHGTTARVSVSNTGAQAEGPSSDPSVSDFGKAVAFVSRAMNLVPETGESGLSVTERVYVRDLDTGTTELVSRSTAGVPSNGFSDSPSISADSRYVVFRSTANNLVAGGSGEMFIYLHDRELNTTERVSVDTSGGPMTQSSAPSVSGDGRYVAFSSGQYVYVRDRQLGVTETISVDNEGRRYPGSNPRISYDGKSVAFQSSSGFLIYPNDTNGNLDVFVRDRQAGTTERVSVNNAGGQVSGASDYPTISYNGRYVAFWSDDSTLVAGDTNAKPDIFVRDRQAGTTTRVNVGSGGEQADYEAESRSEISGDGANVVFYSFATNLVPGDTNLQEDVFVRGPGRHDISVSAAPPEGGEVYGGGSYPSGDLRQVHASPATGYRFLSWTEGGTVVSTSATHTFTLTADRDLVANFEPTGSNFTIQVSASPAAGGTVSGAGTFASGSSRTVRAVAKSGYAFVKWMEGATQVSTAANFTFTLVNNRNLVAHFKRVYTIQVSASPAAGGTVTGGGTFDAGTSRTVRANAASGYVFLRWKEGAAQVHTGPNYTFTLTSNRTLVAEFERRYTLAVSASPAAGGTVTGGGTFAHGSSRTVNATVKPGYEFLNWTEGANQVAITPSYTFTLTANRTLRANFKLRDTPKNDLLVDRGAEGLYLFKNNATWQKIHNGSPTVMAAADVNGNGKDDVIFAMTTPAAWVGLWQRLDTGTIARLHTRAALRLAAGDVDNNGRDEILATFSGQTGTYIRLNGAGAFASIHAQTARLVAFGDLNGNKKADVIIVLADGIWVRYDNAGAWVKRFTLLPALIATGDYDKNGKWDIAIGRGAAGVWRYLNNVAPWQRIDTRNASALAAGDPDGDGRIDILATYPDGLWMFRSATQTWMRLHTLRPTHIAAADLDGNGKGEVAAILPGQGLRARMNDTATWRILLASPQPQDVIAGGFD